MKYDQQNPDDQNPYYIEIDETEEKQFPRLRDALKSRQPANIHDALIELLGINEDIEKKARYALAEPEEERFSRLRLASHWHIDEIKKAAVLELSKLDSYQKGRYNRWLQEHSPTSPRSPHSPRTLPSSASSSSSSSQALINTTQANANQSQVIAGNNDPLNNTTTSIDLAPVSNNPPIVHQHLRRRSEHDIREQVLLANTKKLSRNSNPVLDNNESTQMNSQPTKSRKKSCLNCSIQ